MLKSEAQPDLRIQTTEPKIIRESKSGSAIQGKESTISNLRSRESLSKLTNRLK